MYSIDCNEMINNQATENFSHRFIDFCIAQRSSILLTEDRESFYRSSIKNIVEGVGFSIPNPFSDGDITANSSFIFTGGRNILLFQVKDEFVFIIQKYYFIDQIYFLNKDIFIKLGDLFDDEIKFLKNLKSYFYEHEDELLRSRKKFGFVLDSGRPFHALYPILGSLNYINKTFERNDSFKIISCYLGERCFLDYSLLFPWVKKSEYESDTIWVRIENWSFCNRLDLDEKLVSISRFSKIEQELANKVEESDVIIWADLNSEKRKLTTRAEFYIKLIRYLCETYNECRFLFIFDGLTDHRNRININGIDVNDLNSLNELMLESLQLSNFRFAHISGYGVLQKLHVAEYIDYFISDAGTASMYPDRFHKKIGLTYKPLNWSAHGHVHFNSKIIPERYVTNINDDRAYVLSDYFISVETLISYSLSDLVDIINTKLGAREGF